MRLETSAARYVERYGGTTKRLRTVLRRKVAKAARESELDVPALHAEIEEIVARYAASGLVDDAAFAASRASRLVRRGVSPSVIRGRLAGEGLDSGPAIAAIEGDVTLLAACALVRRRRLGAFRPAGPDAKDLPRLARAGFPYAVAKRVLAMTMEEIEEVGR